MRDRCTQRRILVGRATRIQSHVPFGGLTTRLLREVKVGADIVQATDALQELGRNPSTRPLAKHCFQKVRNPHGQNKPSWRGFLLYAQLVAQVAVAYAAQDGARDARKKTARILGLSDERTRDLLSRDRRRKYLTPTIAGRAGGLLTPQGEAAARAYRDPGNAQRRRKP
jgi:hypothetical protein